MHTVANQYALHTVFAIMCGVALESFDAEVSVKFIESMDYVFSSISTRRITNPRFKYFAVVHAKRVPFPVRAQGHAWPHRQHSREACSRATTTRSLVHGLIVIMYFISEMATVHSSCFNLDDITAMKDLFLSLTSIRI